MLNSGGIHMTTPERRRHTRFACATDLEIDWGSEILRASVRDISLSGMFVATPAPLWIRAEFTARILLPVVLPVECIVRRVEPGRGMAVEFKDLTDATRNSIDEWLRKLAEG